MALVQEVGPLREQVAEEVRALMARRRISGVQIAKRIGRSQTYIWRRLSGETAFDLDDLQALAVVLDVEVIDLFGYSKSRGNEQDAVWIKHNLCTPPRMVISRSTWVSARTRDASCTHRQYLESLWVLAA